MSRNIDINGKTMCGSGNKNQKALHIISAWSEEDGLSLGQKVVEEKSNEITVIPELLHTLNIKNHVITIDAMGTQVKIVEQIIKQKGSYVLTEYCQTNDVKWMNEKSRWKGLKTIGMVQNTIKRDGNISIERRYYISSEKVDIDLFEKCCRGHWAIESMHWHLDVTFREDANRH